MDILTVSHLTKIYGEGEAATRALDDVSFSVEEGEFVAIVGSSGSGKSTLLHLIGGVDRPTSGHVLLNGADVYARSDEELAVFRRREVGLVTSPRATWTPATVARSCSFCAIPTANSARP